VASALEVWAVDPLVKVFRDARPSGRGDALAEVARGEHASLQIVVRSAEAIARLRAEVSPLVLEGEDDGPLKPRRARFVGYVPVDRPTQTPSSDQLRKPPADFPDPLLEVDTIDVAPGHAQPVWVTAPIPADARPGDYRGHLSLSATVSGKRVSARWPLTIRVFRATVGRSRLWVTNWFAMQWRHMQLSPAKDSPQYWELLRRYARNMADHRQNVALISPLHLAEYRVGKEGRLEMDFARFDRWVEIFVEEGVIGRIEGGHLGGRSGGWDSSFVVHVRQVKDGKVHAASVDPASADAERFYALWLPRLMRHLRERGWLDHYMQHLADEPTVKNAESYRAIARLVRKHAPELRIIEACHFKDLTGSIDIWVPQLNYLHRDFDHYRQRQEAGDEVWFYTCVFPQGEYANRFIEQPLLKTRILHWINYRYGVTGYLHWGYNHWTPDSPFTHTTRPHGGPPYLPAGDPWIVYPGSDGPLDSIRHEAMRDGVADYELLSRLAERDPETAMKLVSRHVGSFDRYGCDVQAFRSTRRQLLDRLSSR